VTRGMKVNVGRNSMAAWAGRSSGFTRITALAAPRVATSDLFSTSYAALINCDCRQSLAPKGSSATLCMTIAGLRTCERPTAWLGM
jgi:hypothetical protein